MGSLLTSGTRELSGAPTESGIFVATIVARDDDRNTNDDGVLTFRIVVEEDTNPSFGVSSIDSPPYTQGVEIVLALPPATTDGNQPLRYQVPSLPAGLRFDPNTQIISGIPSEVGTPSYRLHCPRQKQQPRLD